MEPLDPKLARLVHEGMVQAVPGPEVEARVLEGLLARLSPGGPGGPGGDDGPTGQGAGPGGAEAAAALGKAAGSKTLLWVGVLGVTALATAIGVGMTHSPKPERNVAASTPPEATASAGDSTPATPPRTVEPGPSPAARDLEATPVETPREAAIPSRPPAKRPPSSASVRSTAEPTLEPASPDELAAEIQRIAAADRALARGDARAALELARAHAKAHPHGQLGLERDAIELRARCLLGEPGAVEAAAAFVREHAEAPVAAKVRTRCAAAK